MPQNFPEVWLNRVIQNLDNSDEASFLNGIPELDVPVNQINKGQMSEKNIIYVPTTEFEVDVLINNNTYPIPVQEYDDDTITIELDKFQSKVVTLSDDKVIGASYDKIDTATKATTRSMLSKKYKKAIHRIAPASNTATTPVIKTTGDDDGTGRKRLTYEDLVAFKDACDKAGFEEENRRLVLCGDHWNDLLLDRKRFGNLLVDYTKGKPAPVIAGFELHRYPVMPVYTVATKTKKPFGAVKDDGDTYASVAFVTTRIAKKTGLTKQYYVPAAQNPKGQANELAYRHYFIAAPYQQRHIGAIISDILGDGDV